MRSPSLDRRIQNRYHLIGALLLIDVLLFGCGRSLAADTVREIIVPAYAYPIVNIPGKTITSLIVTYPPAGRTPPHRHGRSFVIAYVLSGSVRSKLESGAEKVYVAGDSWTEAPGAVHTVSENASTTEPATIMAILIHDTSAKDLITFERDKEKLSK